MVAERCQLSRSERKHIDDVVTVNMDADGVDEDDTADVGGVSHGKLGRDPAAH